MNATTVIQLYVFVLAGFVGYQAGSGDHRISNILGCIAVACAMINVVGGFIITDRMLKMFKRADKPEGGK